MYPGFWYTLTHKEDFPTMIRRPSPKNRDRENGMQPSSGPVWGEVLRISNQYPENNHIDISITSDEIGKGSFAQPWSWGRRARNRLSGVRKNMFSAICLLYQILRWAQNRRLPCVIPMGREQLTSYS
jgi:hypothetical protein